MCSLFYKVIFYMSIFGNRPLLKKMHTHKIPVNILEINILHNTICFWINIFFSFGLPLTGAYDPGVGYCEVMNVYCLVYSL